ncbi:MAG: GGDEF domain-containing protein [Lachnospiraceae bacterium]|nr:GGDEF domain-containing protein [Lachnospiraceae bacterium]
MIDTKFDTAYAAGRFDLSLNILDGNPQMFNLMGVDSYYSIYKMLSDDEQKKVAATAAKCLETPELSYDECVHITFDGKLCCYILTIMLVPGGGAYDIKLINVSNTENRVNELNRRIITAREYIALTGEAIFKYDYDTQRFHLYYVNQQQNVTIFDQNFEEWITQMLAENRIAQEDMETFEAFCAALRNAKNSQTYTFHGCIISDANMLERYRVSFKPKKYENGDAVVIGTWAIIHEATGDTNATILEDSYVDSLTGLLNKKSIIKYAEDALQSENREHIALSIIDIDDFKSVNDNFGHLFGDKVIKAVANVIKNAVGTSGVAGRIGGDEFFIVFEKLNNELEYRNVLRCIKTNVAIQYQDQMERKLSCSIGLARYGIGPFSTTYHDLFKIADRSLYLAKVKGKNRYIIYKPELHGDFNVQNDDDIINVSNTFYSETDINALHNMLTDLIVYGVDSVTEVLDFFAHVLTLNRVSIFLSDNGAPAYTNTLSPDIPMADPSVLKNLKYLYLFTNNLLAVSNLQSLEFSTPEVYKLLSDTGVACFMQYIIRDREGEAVGLISADVFDRRSAFPKIALTLFSDMSRIMNAVFIRENLI